jgi:mannose-1-phosphate guanylyltransferase
MLAADHVIRDEAAFTNAVSRAVPLAETGKLASFDIVPSEPHTGYGYIQKGSGDGAGFAVEKFVVKPSSTIAEEYLKSGDYLWNSGMSLFRAGRYLEELENYARYFRGMQGFG